MADVLAQSEYPSRYFHVLGSATSNPAALDSKRRVRFARYRALSYHEIVLGFIRADGRSRWLTHEEVTRGVLRAFDLERPRFVIGTLRPWSARP